MDNENPSANALSDNGDGRLGFISRGGITVIGVGNEFRSDDGVGIAEVRQLRTILPEDITLLEHSGEGASLIEAFGSADLVILIDAVRSGAPPGTVHRVDLRKERVPACFLAGSSHAFGVIEAVGTAAVLRRMPRRALLFGIEGESFDAGTSLSDAVRATLPLLSDMILRELNAPQPPPK